MSPQAGSNLGMPRIVAGWYNLGMSLTPEEVGLARTPRRASVSRRRRPDVGHPSLRAGSPSRFGPEKIILFGSHAYGRPHGDSDVDVLVVMPARNELDQAVKISLAIDPPFPLDIIVRTPETLRWRLAEGDSFLREITARGKVLYEAADAGMGEQG